MEANQSLIIFNLLNAADEPNYGNGSNLLWFNSDTSLAPYGAENTSALVSFWTNSTISTSPPTRSTSGSGRSSSWWSSGRIQIPLYAVILLLAIVGNALVILTLVQNRRMRTITNVFLLNLAISDILLGVLCMPFTLIGALLRDFVFGELMCKCLPFLQATSVSVSAWTLVAISCERYYAICHPLRSRRWQTLSHAYRLIALIWIGSLMTMSPIAFLSQLIPTNNGHHKCREQWPEESPDFERSFNIMLDVVLLILPLLLLATTYFLITKTLWKGMLAERITRRHSKCDQHTMYHPCQIATMVPAPDTPIRIHQKMAERTSFGPPAYAKRYSSINNNHQESQITCTNMAYTNTRCRSSRNNNPGVVWHRIGSDQHQQQQYKYSMTVDDPNGCGNIGKKISFGLRRTNTEKSLQNKKRVIKMLFVVVLEFFICWTPLYVINTIALFDPNFVYQKIGYQTITFLQLMAYSSSCCNPITYCFMNRGFRKACLNLFRCCRSRHNGAALGRRFSMVGAATQSSEMT